MILFFNVRITSEPSAHYKQNRGNLSHYTSYDIFRYTLASYSPLSHLFSRVIIYVKLDNEFSTREDDLSEWIYEHFPKEIVSLYWYRNNSLEDFRKASKELDLYNDDIIWFQGNHDHPFIDSDTLTVESAVKHLKEDSDPMASVWFTHCTEMLRNSNNGPVTEDNRFVKCHHSENSSIKIIKRPHWDWYWFKNNKPGLIYRFDNYGSPVPPCHIGYVPIKEMSRHFDGYSHVRVNLSVMPPLDIPKGFFEKSIVIHYGFDDRDNNCVNINPLSPSCYTIDKNSADYKIALDEIPLFWKNKIKEIVINPDVDEKKLIEARNRNIAERINVDFDGKKLTHLSPEKYNWLFK